MRSTLHPLLAKVGLAAAALALGCASTKNPAGEGSSEDKLWTPAVYLTAGARELDHGDFEGADGMSTLGVEAVGWVRDWPVQPELGFVGSEQSGDGDVGGTSTRFEGRVLELYGGARKQWKLGLLWPYVGGGFTIVDAQLEQTPSGGATTSDSQTSLGVYARIGLDLMLTRSLSLGIDGRYVFGSELEVDGTTTSADGGIGTLRLGWAF